LELHLLAGHKLPDPQVPCLHLRGLEFTHLELHPQTDLCFGDLVVLGPVLDVPVGTLVVSFFCTGKLWGGQDHAFQF
jgi:hypothetical protein